MFMAFNVLSSGCNYCTSSCTFCSNLGLEQRFLMADQYLDKLQMNLKLIPDFHNMAVEIYQLIENRLVLICLYSEDKWTNVVKKRQDLVKSLQSEIRYLEQRISKIQGVN